jgi:hypothetical protein
MSFIHGTGVAVTMYIEMKSTEPGIILAEIRRTMEFENPVSVTLNKRGDTYVATLIQVTEEEPEALPT